MVTRKLIRITSPEAGALMAAKETSAAEDSTAVNKQPTTLLTNDNSNEKNGGEKKRPLPSKDMISGKAIKKRQRTDKFVIDLTDVPPQLPIPKTKGRIKDGGSKYAGIHFNKAENKWQAQIYIGGKQRHIGYYENEEEAAVDYSTALFKYKGQDRSARQSERTKIVCTCC